MSWPFYAVRNLGGPGSKKSRFNNPAQNKKAEHYVIKKIRDVKKQNNQERRVD